MIRRLIIESLTKPKKVLNRVISDNLNKESFKVIYLIGVIMFLENAKNNNIGDNLSFFVILIFALIFGLIGGLLYIYLWGGLIKITGKIFNGTATSGELRFGLIWSGSPLFIIIIIHILELFLFWGEAYSSHRLISIQQNNFLAISVLFLSGVRITVFIWWLILMIINISFVQKFSIFKAIINLMIVLIPLTVLGYFIVNMIK